MSCLTCDKSFSMIYACDWPDRKLSSIAGKYRAFRLHCWRAFEIFWVYCDCTAVILVSVAIFEGELSSGTLALAEIVKWGKCDSN